MERVDYIEVENNSSNHYSEEIVAFYNRYFPEESNQLIAKNSTVFWLAKRDNELIGVMRMLTDRSRYGLLLDLIVRKVERNKGIGKSLVRLAQQYCTRNGINHLILTTDPRSQWLTDFYKRLDFRIVEDESLMEFTHQPFLTK